MEKIDAVGELLDIRWKTHGVSMEGGLSTIYSETLAKLRAWLRATGGGAIQRLTRSPWQEESFRKMILGQLTDPKDAELFKFNDKGSTLTGPDAGWFTIGGQPLASRTRLNLYEAWNDEVNEYIKLTQQYKGTCLKYLDWALNATQAILLADHRGVGADYDLIVKDRPQTVAEALLKEQVYWVGMKTVTRLAITKQFGASDLTIIDIPVKAPKVNQVPVPGVGRGEIVQYAKTYETYDNLINDLNDLFEQMDRRVNKLKSYREIAKTDEAYHRILTDVDQEMQLYFNVELFAALYSRAASIQSAIGHYIHHNLQPA